MSWRHWHPSWRHWWRHCHLSGEEQLQNALQKEEALEEDLSQFYHLGNSLPDHLSKVRHLYIKEDLEQDEDDWEFSIQQAAEHLKSLEDIHLFVDSLGFGGVDFLETLRHRFPHLKRFTFKHRLCELHMTSWRDTYNWQLRAPLRRTSLNIFLRWFA